MFKHIHLGNFKAFSQTQTIPLRPLTLIFGPNSSGKSSLIHGLLFAHEALTNEESDNLDVKRPRIGGDSVDLGGFRQFVHRRNMENRVEWGVTIDTSLLPGRIGELLKAVKEITISLHIGLTKIKDRDIIVVQSYELQTGENSLLRASLKRDAEQFRMGLDELDYENELIKTTIDAIIETATTTDKLSKQDMAFVSDSIDKLVPSLSLKMGNFLPNGILFPQSFKPQKEQFSFFPISKGDRQEDLSQAIEFFLPRTLNDLIKGLNDVVTVNLKKLRYLGPLRSYPSRHVAFSQEYDTNWYAGGGSAWDKVREDVTIREKVNAWLSDETRMKTPYELQIVSMSDSAALESEFWTTLETVFAQIQSRDPESEITTTTPEPSQLSLFPDHERTEQLELLLAERGETNIFDLLKSKDYEGAIDLIRRMFQEKIKVPGINDLRFIDKRTNTEVSHRDIGIGVSQVLPVLVAAFGAKDEIHTMEQPELHLHPALQAELGDVFIEAALNNNNTFILETHSEHIILRLLRRIRETTAKKNKATPPIKPEDVCLLYCKPTAEGSELMQIRIDKHGRLIDQCPDGFFEEDFKELF